MKLLLIDLNSSDDERNEPIGILSLAEFVKPLYQGLEIYIINSYDENLSSFDFSGFDLIGISAKIGTLEQLFSLLKRIEAGNHCVFVGNSLGTYEYENILKRFPNVICCRYEGELFLSELIKQSLEAGGGDLDLSCLPNAAYNKWGKVVENEEVVVELLDYPAIGNRTLYDDGTLYRVEGSRGCSWSRCSFCSIPQKYKCQYRAFDVTSVVDNICHASIAGIRELYFTDEDFFGGDYNRIDNLCDLILKNKDDKKIAVNTSFFVSVKPFDIIKCPSHLLSKLHHTGFRTLFLGVESGSASQLKRYGKLGTPETNREAIDIVFENGFELDVGFIMFDPLVTMEELFDNIAFINQCILGRTVARLFKPLLLHKKSRYYEKYSDLIRVDRSKESGYFVPYIMGDHVHSVFDSYSRYELEHADRAKFLQNEYRLGNEDVFHELNRLRELEFQEFKKIAQCIE